MKRIFYELLAIASFLVLGGRAMGAPTTLPVLEIQSIDTHVIGQVAESTPIPEPTSIAIVLFGAIALLTRRSGRAAAATTPEAHPLTEMSGSGLNHDQTTH